MDWTVMKMVVNSLSSALCKGVLLLWALFAVVSAGEIESGMPLPVFEKPDVFSRVMQTLPPGKYETSAPLQRTFSVRHPIAYYGRFAPLKSGGFASPDISVDREGNPFFLAPSFQWQTPLSAVLIAALSVLIFLFVKGKRAGEIENDSVKESFFFIMTAVLVRQILILLETSFWGNALPCAADEPGYFKVAYDVLHGSFKGPWNFTAGLGIFYLPFILLTGAKQYYDIAVIFSYVDALVIVPCGIAAAFPVLKNFGVKKYAAFAAVLIWALYPFFIYHAELWDAKIFKPLAALPCFLDGVPDWWRFYGVCINAGFNAMSDAPGLTAVFCTLLLAQKLAVKRLNMFLVGAAFGFCCLIRINYIFFAPVLAFICFSKAPLDNKTELLKLVAAAGAGFLALFGWQLLINQYQFGNILVFGYSLHYLDFPPEKRPDTGFNWSTLLEWQNIRFLVGANKFLMTGGIAGLCFLRERRLRIALTLTAVPLILFFFGYTHTYCDARRFIMMAFPVFIAAFCCGIANLSALDGRGWRKYLPVGIIPVMAVLWLMPAEIFAICLCLLLLRSVFDLQQELRRGILIK